MEGQIGVAVALSNRLRFPEEGHPDMIDFAGVFQRPIVLAQVGLMWLLKFTVYVQVCCLSLV